MGKQVKPAVKLISYTPNPEGLVAAAARICYSPDDVETIMDNMTPKQVDNLINRLTNMGHESPFEHANFTFSVTGVSRVLLAQESRHRLQTLSVRSQRYNSESDFSYVVPTEIERLGLEEFYIERIEQIQDFYEDVFIAMMDEYLYAEYQANPEDEALKEFVRLYNEDIVEALDYIREKQPKIWSKYDKRAAENARYLCPGATETKFAVTMNARELLHFFELRCCNRAQEEIRDMATLMLAEVLKVAPKLFRLAGPGCTNGACPEGSMGCGKAADVRKKYNSMKEGL